MISFVETLRKFIIAKLSIRIIISIISTDEDRALGSKTLQYTCCFHKTKLIIDYKF